MNTIKTRKEAAELVNRQLRESPEKGKTVLYGMPKGNQHHYGKQDLRELLDFIYGGPPANDDEKVQ